MKDCYEDLYSWPKWNKRQLKHNLTSVKISNICIEIILRENTMFLYSIKFYNKRYSSKATYKLLYYTTRTNAAKSKNPWQLRSLNIEKKIKKKKRALSLSQVRGHKFQKEAIKFAPLWQVSTM